ncbi:unnamed protein product [Caenorhabditis bovis]|uniref:Uncharacterized protein n=1 Tax=Caenorhabditis bovis TaxID=2654633 RepID=A0A8S1EW95_9PELO|nr:unnamed protein product [Caenorhabditis bovis]
MIIVPFLLLFPCVLTQKLDLQNRGETDSDEIDDEDVNIEKSMTDFLYKRMKQDFGLKKRFPPDVYSIPGPQEPLPGRTHQGDYWPVFPFQNQYSGGLDLDPSISRHIGGDMNIAVPSWGLLDIYGRFFNRISDTTTKLGYINHPVNMMDLEKDDFTRLMSDPGLTHNRLIHPKLPLGKLAKSYVPVSCKPPMCNPYQMNLGVGVEHDIGGHDGIEGDIDVPMPISKGLAYRFPISGKVYYDLDNITISYGQNLAPIEPFSSLFDYQKHRDPALGIPRRFDRSVPEYGPSKPMFRRGMSSEIALLRYNGMLEELELRNFEAQVEMEAQMYGQLLGNQYLSATENKLNLQNEGSDEEVEPDDDEPLMAKSVQDFLFRRMNQDLGIKKPLKPLPYRIPGAQEPLPGRSHHGDYFPVFPFQNQFSAGLDLDPGISRHMGGGMNIAVPTWGMMDWYGRAYYSRTSDTTTKIGYLNHPVNMLDLEKDDFVKLMSDPKLQHNRKAHPTIPLGTVPRRYRPISCKPPLCNPYHGTFAIGIEHDFGGGDGFEGDIDVPMPVSKGIGYRFPFSGNIYYKLANMSVSYGQNLAPIEPFSSLFDYQKHRDPALGIPRRWTRSTTELHNSMVRRSRPIHRNPQIEMLQYYGMLEEMELRKFEAQVQMEAQIYGQLLENPFSSSIMPRQTPFINQNDCFCWMHMLQKNYQGRVLHGTRKSNTYLQTVRNPYTRKRKYLQYMETPQSLQIYPKSSNLNDYAQMYDSIYQPFPL